MKSNKKNLLSEQRRQKILDLLVEEGGARVVELSELFGVSEPTVRQDLEKLEAAGHIVRERGGAYSKSVPHQVQNQQLQHAENMDKKTAIGMAAAALVGDGESIILDAGSTTTEVANNLKDRRELKITTNALNIALILGAEPTNSVHVTGGEFKAPTLSLSGMKAGAFFDNIYAQKLFLAVGGISFDAGLTYPGFNDLDVKSAMVKSAARVYLVADSTKIGKVSFASLGGVEMIHALITDDGISADARRAFEQKGVEVIIAPST